MQFLEIVLGRSRWSPQCFLRSFQPHEKVYYTIHSTMYRIGYWHEELILDRLDSEHPDLTADLCFDILAKYPKWNGVGDSRNLIYLIRIEKCHFARVHAHIGGIDKDHQHRCNLAQYTGAVLRNSTGINSVEILRQIRFLQAVDGNQPNCIITLQGISDSNQHDRISRLLDQGREGFRQAFLPGGIPHLLHAHNRS